ncbi:hypothetical protein J437_LFUL006635 [Ladona fulva]|uniref:Uncharacterized protein n=1 Tax=Ladona fulva TaxID=123851 RepID=A0A8K0P6E3_LADFU|nr:hypothetical protein J437_LFUL006635 [Ladona fulva]
MTTLGEVMVNEIKREYDANKRSVAVVSFQTWHSRLGYPNERAMRKLSVLEESMGKGKRGEMEDCLPCIQRKMRRGPFSFGKQMAGNYSSKKKCRQYNVDYLKYGFIQSPINKHMPMCLLCERVFSNKAMKPSRLIDHSRKAHPDKTEKTLTFFQSLRDRVQNHSILSSMLCNASIHITNGLRASYNISLLIAKSGKPHTIGEELILPAVSEVLRSVLHKPPYDTIEIIP